MNTADANRRYVVHDSLAVTASHLITKSARSSRYGVLDTLLNRVVDEYASKAAAESDVRERNLEARQLDWAQSDAELRYKTQ